MIISKVQLEAVQLTITFSPLLIKDHHSHILFLVWKFQRTSWRKGGGGGDNHHQKSTRHSSSSTLLLFFYWTTGGKFFWWKRKTSNNSIMSQFSAPFISFSALIITSRVGIQKRRCEERRGGIFVPLENDFQKKSHNKKRGKKTEKSLTFWW